MIGWGMASIFGRTVWQEQKTVLRELDCAVIERIHQLNREMGKKPYDSVRGVFIEGSPVYKDSGIMEKTHTQLCIRNPNCIKGYFKPLIPDSSWSLV